MTADDIESELRNETAPRNEGPEVPNELTARLAEMPSCLDQLAAARR